MLKREAKSSIKFRHYITANPGHTCSYEMKDTRDKGVFYLREIKDAQVRYGLAIASEQGVLLRVEAISEGMPDYVYLRNVPAYFTIKYPEGFLVLDVHTIDKLKKQGVSSLTFLAAKELAIKYIR